MSACGPYDDNKWRAENDARTLIEANAVKSDSERFSRAMQHLRETTERANRVLKGKQATDAQVAQQGYTKL